MLALSSVKIFTSESVVGPRDADGMIRSSFFASFPERGSHLRISTYIVTAAGIGRMDAAFVAEDITTVVSSAIGSVLSNASYTPNKTKDWSNSIIQSSLKGLQSLNRPYKYCLTVTLMQKNGAGLVSAASVYWDPTKDGVCKVSWENETMHCVVVVFGVSVNVDDAPEDYLFEGDGACAKKVDSIAAEAEM